MKKPITIINGIIRANNGIPKKLYSKIGGAHRLLIVPYRTELGIACMFNGRISNYPEEEVLSQFEPKKANIVCECGKEKHGFAAHSSWCPKGDV